jgi:drug/metabolite transporter (DMT)-like permease
MRAATKESAVGLPATVSTQSATGLAILCWLLAAGVYIAAKVVTTEMPPWALCFWQFVGSIIAFIGMAIIVTRGDLLALLRLDLNTGELLVVCAAIAFAVYTVLLRRTKYELPGLPLLVLLLGGAAVMTAPFYVWELFHDDRTALNAKGMWALLYVAGPGGALMYYLFNLSVQALGASRAGVFLYLQTVFIAVLAYFLLNERLLSYHLVGAFFILVGVLLVMLLKPAARTVTEPANRK